jgi:hypothetical protein
MANPQRFKNNVSTSLSSSIASTGDPVTIAVSSAAGFPTGGNFTVLVDSELFLVTAVSGTNFTASRAQESTSMAAHSSGAVVTLIVSAVNIITAMQDAMYQSTLANKLTAEQAGRLLFPTDAHKLLRDDGSAWQPYGKLERWYEPSDSGFSWVRQGTATLDTNNYGLYLYRTDFNNNTWAMRMKSAPTAPYTIDIRFQVNHYYKSAHKVGFGWRQNSASKTHFGTCSLTSGGSNYGRPGFSSTKYTVITTSDIAADYVSYGMGNEFPRWVRLKDDNTNREIYFSYDGIGYNLLHSVSRTDFMTYDQVGFGIMKDANDANKMGLRILSWREY